MGKKKIRPSGLVLRGSTYYFRLDLPNEVRPALGRTAVWESLGTADYDRAIAAWGPKHSEWKQKIADARAGTLRSLSNDLVEAIGRELISGEAMVFRSRAEIIAFIDSQLIRPFQPIDGQWVYPSRLTQADRDAILAWVEDHYLWHTAMVAQRFRDTAENQEQQAEKYRQRHPEAPRPSGYRLMDAFEDWKRAKNPRPKSTDEFQAACGEFIRVVGDLPLTELTKHSFVKFKKHLLEATKADGKPVSQSTRVKRFGAVKAVIAVAVENLDIESHPGDGVVMGKAPKSKLRTDGLMDDEIDALFDGPIHRDGERPRGGGGEASYWLPIIALHSGARLSELAQLNVVDIITQDGVKCFRVIDNPEGNQSIKNEGSHRLIPIHRRIIELGFFDYLATLDADGRLFPQVRADSHGVAGGLFSKFFGKYRKSIGITRKGADFHATRHHVKTLLRSIPGDDEVKLAITGHSNGNVSASYGRISVKEMKKLIDQIAYEVTIPKWKSSKAAS